MEEGEDQEECDLGVDEGKEGEKTDTKTEKKIVVNDNLDNDIIETDVLSSSGSKMNIDKVEVEGESFSESKPYYCQDVQVNGKGPVFRVTLTLVGTIFLPNAEGKYVLPLRSRCSSVCVFYYFSAFRLFSCQYITLLLYYRYSMFFD